MVDPRDGKTYRTIGIWKQTWMAENLNYETQGSYCYSNNESNCTKYGRLYLWNAALKVCPSGWHLPSTTEFETLFESVGGRRVVGKILKSKKGWKNGGNGTDDFGFSAFSAGGSYSKAGYRNMGFYAGFWSSTEYNSDGAYYMLLHYDFDYADLNLNDKFYGFSVRCVKD
jgi:uncharacterized protein (TIGR02145 family)